MTQPPAASARPARRLSGRGWIIFAVAALAVVVAAVVGIRGLIASPVEGLAPDGRTVLRGTWEPYTCTASVCQGYLTAGARSVFIVFPSGCPQPSRAAELTVHGRQDSSLGSDAYRVAACAA
ncbi:MAG: hypothetical protein M3R48_10005 [Candidatus Dormibacteraeota bacterium]|nr:hypothetical protein [Candidatus Dormibacteraeota bacterium]